MHLLDIHRRPESFESRQPDNPIVDVGVEPRRLAAERIDALFSHGERKPCIVGETVLLFQVGVAARQEVEVVERREPVVARDGGLGHDVAPLGNRIIGEEGWNNRGPLRPEHLFAQRERQAQPVGGHPLGRNIPRQFDAPLVITHDHFFIVPLRYRLGIELQHVPVLALHEMLVHGDIGSKEPFLADVVLPFDGAVKRIDETPRANHLRPVPVTFVLREIVSLPRMYIPSTSPDLIIFSPMIPRKNTAESLFTLFVAILRIGTIIDVEHRNAAPRMDIPRLQSEPVAPARVVISLLEHVQVVEIPALVPLDGIVRADDVAVVIVDIHLLVVVPIPEIEEQKKIATCIVNLNSLITLHQRKCDETKRLKKYMLQKMFPQNGEKVPEIRFSGFTDDWEQRKLGDIGKARSGVGFPDAEQGGVTGIPFFKVSDMNLDGNENEMTVANNYVTAEQIAVHRWSPITELPAIFFAKVGAAVMLNRKRLCRFPFLLDNNTMAYSLSSTKWDADFAKALFGTVDLTSLVQVGALPSYNARDVESMEIYLPSLLEQEQIGGFFKQLDTLITLHQRELENLQNIKKFMLGKMFV